MNNLVECLRFFLDSDLTGFFYPDDNLFIIGPITADFQKKYIKKQYRRWDYYGITYTPENNENVYIELDSIAKYCTQKTQRYLKDLKFRALTQQGHL